MAGDLSCVGNGVKCTECAVLVALYLRIVFALLSQYVRTELRRACSIHWTNAVCGYFYVGRPARDQGLV